MFRPTLDTVSLLLISITGLSPSAAKLSNLLIYHPKYRIQSTTPGTSTWFALIQFRSPLLSESRLISLPSGTEMFHFPEFAPLCGDTIHTVPGCPIQKSPDQSFLAAPRGFSQPSTSFIASTSQGIHLWPLISFFLICASLPYLMYFHTLNNSVNLFVVI